jgi:hypothetical protein
VNGVAGKPLPRHVFLSHTTELRRLPVGGSFVAAAESAVSRAGDAVVDMRYFTADDADPASICRDAVSRADVYVVIAGFRYGTAVREEPALSYTELEYRTAEQRGIPCLVFVLSEDVEGPAELFLDLETGDQQRRFRDQLTGSTHTVAFVDSPNDLEVRLLQALVQLPHDGAADPPAAEPGSGPLPYSLIRPTARATNWHALLDGSPVAASAATGALPRTITIDGSLHTPAEALSWLSRHPGRTLVLSGSKGEGKTTYVNTLAALAGPSHSFALLHRDQPLSVEVVARAAIELTRTAATTVVVVYRLEHATSLDQLAHELQAVGSANWAATVLIEGSEGELAHLPSYSAHEARLAPIGPALVPAWVALLRRARREIEDAGAEPAWIRDRYPNLDAFLQLNPGEQERVLADDEAPMIVRLLRAVYGTNMWGRLYDELRRLNPKSPDAITYMHVCLASLTDRGLPTYVVEALQPEAQWDVRCRHDPWVLRDDNHVARHRLIAQVVLEKSARWTGARQIGLCVDAYAVRLSSAPYAALLRQVVAVLAVLQPVADPGDTDKLRWAVFSGARRALRKVDGLAGTIAAHCGTDYRRFADWMELCRTLFPRASRDPEHLWLLELHEDLLDIANRCTNAPEPQRIEYYRAKLHRLRAWLLAEDDETTLLLELVHRIAPSIGQPWCRADFYVDLFRWCFDAIDARRTDRLEGPDAVDGEFLYRTLLTAYQRLRTCATDDDINEIRADFVRVVVRYLHWQLPDRATDVVRHGWEVSVALGRPDKLLGTLLAELLLDSRRLDSPDVVRDTLAEVQRAAPEHGESLFLAAFAVRRHRVGVADLADLLDQAEGLAVSPLDRPFCTHARALLADDEQARRALLVDAVEGYLHWIADQRRESVDFGAFAADRLRFALDTALSELGRTDNPQAAALRHRYRRLTGTAGP